MGARNPDRIPRLISWRQTPAGYIRVAVCGGCGHQAALPVEQLVQRFGELFPIETALFRMRCSTCGENKVAAKLLLLCEPGCRRHCA